MSQSYKSRHAIGRQKATPPRTSFVPSTPPLPRPQPIEPTGTTAHAPDPVVTQAKRDIDAGQVDTDMHATPGLDAKLRARLVPGPGGTPPGPVD